MLRIGELYNNSSKIVGKKLFPEFFQAFQDKAEIVKFATKGKIRGCDKFI